MHCRYTTYTNYGSVYFSTDSNLALNGIRNLSSDIPDVTLNRKMYFVNGWADSYAA